MRKIHDEVIDYLQKTYAPEAIITYGSFADGSANEYSDFDALVMAESTITHDAAVIHGTELDVFIFPPDMFQKDYSPGDFVQVYAGRIELDKNGLAAGLQQRVREYIDNEPKKSVKELKQDLDWCRKMLLRTCREDAEGFYRWHWLLIESLEVYCEAMQRPYFGPKKTLRTMEQDDPDSFVLYSAALRDFSQAALQIWIGHLCAMAGEQEARQG